MTLAPGPKSGALFNLDPLHPAPPTITQLHNYHATTQLPHIHTTKQLLQEVTRIALDWGGGVVEVAVFEGLGAAAVTMESDAVAYTLFVRCNTPGAVVGAQSGWALGEKR